MQIILCLHIVVELIVGGVLLFYPQASELIPGFADGSGGSYVMVTKMYGLAAIFLAAIGGLTLQIRKSATHVAFFLVAFLAAFHLLMAGIQFAYNPDTRAMLLHFLLCIFLSGIYVRRREIIEQAAL